MTAPAKNSTAPDVQSLVLSADVLETILHHLQEWLPNEGCGLLAGNIDAYGGGLPVCFYPGSNILHSPTRYRMADPEVIMAMRSIREANHELLAIVHSHPRTPPRPSATDLAELHYPRAAMLIVSFADTVPSLQAWRSGPPMYAIPVRAQHAIQHGCVFL